jgi:EAL domain-containing protein (putative c-di-GMP-specific phosphodiesterase class I)
LPVDIIKFDMSLTRAAFQKQRTAQLIEGLVKDLSAMDYDIVLEGIEDAEMFSMLSLMSPSHFQGYYINKPLAEPNYEIPEMSNKIKLI